jgi:DNA-3-methyladenine glycosylase
VAPDLLGRWLVRDREGERTIARIVEVEAYDGPEDRASHARAGITPRTRPMFGPAGCAYVYLVYGIHHCLNVVTGPEGEASAVLIRAVTAVRPPADGSRAGAGPALACRLLGVDRSLDGHDLLGPGPLWLAEPPPGDREETLRSGVSVGPRIGVDYAGPGWTDRPWRFGIRGHPALSRPFPDGVSRRSARTPCG